MEALIADWRAEDYQVPALAAAAYVRAVRRVVGTWEVVGILASTAAGRELRNPRATAQAWGDGATNIPGDMLFGLQQIPALSHIRLSDYALAPSGADPAEWRELRDEMAELRDQLDRLEQTTNVLVAVVLADQGLGPALRGALARAQEGGVDQAAARYLEQAASDGGAPLVEHEAP